MALLPRPPAADGNTGGIEWVEPLTLDHVGRVPNRVPPSTKGAHEGILNTMVLTWPFFQPEPLAHEVDALAELARVGRESVRRWFGLPTRAGVPRAPRNCVPLKVVGRAARGFLSAEKRRRMCTIWQSEYEYTDPLFALDSEQRELDFLRALFAACACTAYRPPRALYPRLIVGARVEATGYDVGGIYRSLPMAGSRNARGKWNIYEYDYAPRETLAACVQTIRSMVDPDGDYHIDSGHGMASCWVRIWIEAGTGLAPWVVRAWHTYPTKSQHSDIESYDVRTDELDSGGYEPVADALFPEEEDYDL